MAAYQKWDLCILDEVHYCKNLETKRTAFAFDIAQVRDLDVGAIGNPDAQ